MTRRLLLVALLFASASLQAQTRVATLAPLPTAAPESVGPDAIARLAQRVSERLALIPAGDLVVSDDRRWWPRRKCFTSSR